MNIIWPFKVNLTPWASLNTTLFKRLLAVFGFAMSTAALALLGIILKDENTAEVFNSSTHPGNFEPNATTYSVVVVLALVAMSGRHWLNFTSQKVQDTLRRRKKYDLSDIEDRAQYQLQLYPIFALTGPVRILITYGFWQASRNAMLLDGQSDLRPGKIRIENWTAEMNDWFNFAGLVLFLATVILEWTSVTCARAKNSLLFWTGNVLGVLSCSIVLGFFDPHFEEVSNGQFTFGLQRNDQTAALYWVYISLATTAIFLSTIYLVTDNSRDFALERDLFQIPEVGTIFAPISLVLNRKRDDTNDEQQYQAEKTEPDKTSTPTIFICITLWHENIAELTAMLGSLVRLADSNCRKHAKAQAKTRKRKLKCLGGKEAEFYNLDMHVVFDNVFEKVDENKSLNSYVQDFFDVLLVEVGKIDKKCVQNLDPVITPTPYGGKILVKIFDVPLTIHLKDIEYTQNGKRWSQVMYLNYLLKFKTDVEKKDYLSHYSFDKTHGLVRVMAPLDKDHTYIMALDGDVTFKPSAVKLVLDRLEQNDDVAAACNQIKPGGNGWLVWFQRFEYAVGHWLQKTTEHVLGCVLCSPGCFSIIRASYLMLKPANDEQAPIDIYKSHASTPRQKLMYDQGEDRWLCTRILLSGGRIEFEAGSDCDTFAPEELQEFFKQRRRWGPSTTANIYELINQSKLARKNRNISVFYIAYHAISMALSLLGPATTAMMIAQGFEFALRGDTMGSDPDHSSWSLIWPKLVVFLPLIFYAILCWPKWARQYQLKTAEWLTLFYSFFMLYVLVALIVQGARCPLNPTFIFFCTLSGIVTLSGILHGDIVSLICGIVYWATIPSCFILLQLYSIANLNDCSWGTRQSGSANSTETPVDRAWKTMKGCCTKEKQPSDKKQDQKVDVVDKPQYKKLDFKKEINDDKVRISVLKDQPLRGTLHLEGENETAVDENLSDELQNILGNRPTTDFKQEYDLSWIISTQSPKFFKNNPQLQTLTALETMFWRGMVNKENGLIRNFKNDTSLKRKNAELNESMDNFRDKLYGYYLYINFVWIIICTLAQNYSYDWTINILSSSTIDNLLTPDPNVNCTSYFEADNLDLTGSQQSEYFNCINEKTCRSSLERGFAPLEFFFLLFYLILIGIQFLAMLEHRLQTLTHWLGHHDSLKQLIKVMTMKKHDKKEISSEQYRQSPL